MKSLCLLPLLLPALLLAAEPPKLPDIGDAMRKHVAAGAISGAVTMVVTKDRILHLEATGLADIATARPMTTDAVFSIKSMTKPVTGVAVLMLQSEGKLHVDDPVAKYLPKFANLRTPTGQPANLTIAQLLTHTSGLGEGLGENGNASDRPRNLADLVRQALASLMQYEPGTRWKYTQSGINTAARIVEVVSGMGFDQFLSSRLFEPLGMNSTRFYPGEKLQQRMATLYSKNKETGLVEAVPRRAGLAARDRPPLATSGLYSTAPDFGRLCQMLLNGGELDGRRYLSPEALKSLATPRTGDLKAGFVPGSAWGLAAGVVTGPQGVTAMLSPGTYGHGGAYGTQMWIDPAKGVAYILMIHRTGFGNGDASDVRRDFQQAAVDALNR